MLMLIMIINKNQSDQERKFAGGFTEFSLPNLQ